MRILYYGQFDGHSSSRVKGMRMLGHEVRHVYFQHPTKLPHRLLLSLEWRLFTGPITFMTNRQMLRTARELKPDLVWTEMGRLVYPRTLRTLKNDYGCMLVNSYSDDFLDPIKRSPNYDRCIPMFDHIFTPRELNFHELYKYGARQVHKFWKGYNPDMNFPETLSADEEKLYGTDVVFAGHGEPSRIELLTRVAETAKLKVWGDKWQRLELPVTLQRCVQFRRAGGHEYRKAICAAKIGIQCLSTWARDTQASRSFEIPACGVFMIADRTADHQACFEEGKEAEFFGSPDELVDKVKFYLAHDEARRRIAEAGHRRCLSSGYSNLERIRQMLEIVTGKGSNSPRSRRARAPGRSRPKMNDFLQCILALPLAMVGIGCFLRAMVRPGSIGMIRLSVFAFTNQFLLGPIVNAFTHDVPVYCPSADMLLTFGTIYLFFAGVAIVALIWNSRLDPVLMVRDRGLSQERGIWTALTEASLRAPLGGIVCFYGFVTVIRAVMLAQYGAGLSGTATLQQTLSMPYWVLAIHKTFTSLGYTFVYVAVTKLAYRQRGGFWYFLIIITELLTVFLRSRRMLFVLCLLMFFAWLMKHGRIRLRHAVVSLMAGFVLFKVVFPFFYETRAQWQRYPDSPVSVWVSEGWRASRTGGAYGELAARYNKSFVSRLNALQENYQQAGILNSGAKPAYGQFLKAGILFSVPRILWPEKTTTLLVDDELLNSLYPTGGQDLISNLPSFAMVDFGMLGGLIYGAIFGLFLRVVELMMKSLFRRSPVGAMAVFGAVVSDVVLNSEFAPGSLFVTMRLVLSIFLLFYVLSSILGSPAQNAASLEQEHPYPVPR